MGRIPRPKGWLSELEFTKDAADYESVNAPLTNRSVLIVGGGPSLDPETVKPFTEYPAILTNNSYQIFSAPTILVALDKRYLDWHKQAILADKHIIVTSCRDRQYPNLHRETYHRFRKDREATYPPDPGTLTGTNSGHAACALACLLGATRIFVAGFDMGFRNGKTHWHGGHRVPSSEQNYVSRFRPRFEKLVKICESKGVEIKSITETYAKVPRISPEDALKIFQNEASNGHD